jgi:hypothetical protein
MDIQAEFNKLSEDMDIPTIRKDLSREENIGWLISNIAIRNRNHPNLSRVLDIVKDRMQAILNIRRVGSSVV